MKHRFTIVKPIAASLSNVIANYLDIEHIPVHPNLTDVEILSETDTVVCFRMTSRILGIPVTNVHYFEYRPPHQVLQIIKSPLGPMVVLSTARELNSGTPQVLTEVTVETELDLPGWAWPLRHLLERILRASNQRVLDEDLQILLRRQARTGDYIEDYLRPGQPLMCKEAFRNAFSRRGSATEPEPAAPPAG